MTHRGDAAYAERIRVQVGQGWVCFCSHRAGHALSYPDVTSFTRLLDYFCFHSVTWAFSLLLSLSPGAALTKYHRPEGLTNKHVILTILEAGSPRSGCEHGWVLSEGPLWGNFLMWLPCMRAKRDWVFLPLFMRARIPSRGLYPHDLITSQRLHLQIPLHWG